MLKVGQSAPEFELDSTEGRIALKDLHGRWIVLFFYPMDFTFVCPTEVTGFSKEIERFREANAVVLGCSIDSVPVHKAWSKELGGLMFPLLSDINKEVGRIYNVLVEDKGVHLRGVFIIDPDGILQYQAVHSLNVGRSVQEVYRVLKALQTGGLCPIDWKPGEKTIEVTQ